MSALPADRLDSTPATPVVNFAPARFAQRQLEDWLCSEQAKRMPAHQVEEEVLTQGREILRLLLEAHFRERGTGDVGPAVCLRPAPPEDATAPESRAASGPGGSGLLPAKRWHERTLKTVVGPVTIARTAYGAPGQASIHPLDGAAELPAQSFSYPLQARLVRAAVQGPYAEATANVERATGAHVSKRSCEGILREVARDVEAYYRGRHVPAAATTGPILVAGVDGKGIPIVKAERAPHKVRLSKGEKRNKKRMATVATVRTCEPRVRTPEAVVASLFDGEATPQPLRVRREEYQRVWGSLTGGKGAVIREVAEEIRRCDPERTKRRVALCDGERALQEGLTAILPGAVGEVVVILDFIHALEKLWRAAYCFYAEGTPESEAWVRKQALRLLQGRVGQVVKGIRQSATKRRVSQAKREALAKVVGYLWRNRGRMRYDAYLREGLPIASGAVEGACKHLVKDRLERSGMRWTAAGAEAVLQLRAVYLSGDLDAYWEFHQRQEQLRLHPPGAWEAVEK